MTQNGISVLKTDVWRYSWILGLAMFIALLVAIFITYRKPRVYENNEVEVEKIQDTKLTKKHIIMK